MPRDYYVVLGIAASATAEEIHAAFRRRSKELHPDVSGGDSAPFVELQEAYSVLSDPAQRRGYDRAPGRVEARITRRPPRASTVPLRPRPVAEPITSPHAASIMDDFQSFGPSFDELFDRLWSSFGPFTPPKSERLESLHVEVVADPEEARRGGRVRLAVPARIACPLCGGHGILAGVPCWRCGGEGVFVAERSLDVAYPAGMRDGHVVRVPLRSFGIGNFYLTVIFRVAPGEAGSP